MGLATGWPTGLACLSSSKLERDPVLKQLMMDGRTNKVMLRLHTHKHSYTHTPPPRPAYTRACAHAHTETETERGGRQRGCWLSFLSVLLLEENFTLPGAGSGGQKPVLWLVWPRAAHSNGLCGQHRLEVN